MGHFLRVRPRETRCEGVVSGIARSMPSGNLPAGLEGVFRHLHCVLVFPKNTVLEGSATHRLRALSCIVGKGPCKTGLNTLCSAMGEENICSKSSGGRLISRGWLTGISARLVVASLRPEKSSLRRSSPQPSFVDVGLLLNIVIIGFLTGSEICSISVFGSVSVMVNSLCLCASDGTCSFWCMFCQHLLTLSRNRYIIDRGTISNM